MSQVYKFVQHEEVIQTKRPAFCVKTKLKDDKNKKFFINFCHSVSVSSPTICMSETELKQMIENERLEELSQYTIPMILEGILDCKDHRNEIAKVTHVIINRKFYEEYIKNSEVYRSFLIFVTNEIIMAKFNVLIDQGSAIILKNKTHQLPEGQAMFQERILPMKAPESKLIESLDTVSSDKKQSPKPETSNQIESSSEDENIRMKLDIENEIVDIAIKLPSVEVCEKNLQALLNEDHVQIVINSNIYKDFYLPITLVSNLAECFVKKSILSIRCPVIM